MAATATSDRKCGSRDTLSSALIEFANVDLLTVGRVPMENAIISRLRGAPFFVTGFVSVSLSQDGSVVNAVIEVTYESAKVAIQRARLSSRRRRKKEQRKKKKRR